MVRRVVRWTDAEGRGLEQCLLTLDRSGLTLEGVVAGARGGDHAAHYLLRTDPAGRTRELRLRHLGGPDLHLAADETARWRDAARGEALPALDGCIDVDLAMSPATNTLPIRRLQLGTRETADLCVAYVPLPSDAGAPLVPRSVAQRYARIDESTWRFHQPDADFTADLPVDDLGLVLDYPGLFRRVALS